MGVIFGIALMGLGVFCVFLVSPYCNIEKRRWKEEFWVTLCIAFLLFVIIFFSFEVIILGGLVIKMNI